MKTKDIAVNRSSAIDVIFEEYMRHSPEEEGAHKLLSEQLSKQSDIELRRDINTIGHVVVTAFVIDKDNKRILVLDDSKDHFFQLKTHLINTDKNLFDAALRCLGSEAGIDAVEVKYRPAVPGRDDVPFDIDTHVSVDKEKSDHTHHSFGYLFLANDSLVATIDSARPGTYRWISWKEFSSQSYFKKVARKIEELTFRKSASHFFDEVFAMQSSRDADGVYCIAVQHILPSTYKFIVYLNSIFNGRLTILAKPKSIDSSIREKLVGMGITIEVASRDAKQLERCVVENGKKAKVVILDIGAYFVDISTKKGLPILGIIEDTENGHQKYLKSQGPIQYPVLSVARSELKKNEDALVGRSILHATD